MRRYVGILWNARDGVASQFAQHLSRRFVARHAAWEPYCVTAGMYVFASQESDACWQIHKLPNDHGVILGRLFPAKPEHWRQGWKFDPTATSAMKISHSGGSILVRDFWGAYVAFLHDPEGDIHYVIRDCSGKIPCYVTTHRNVSIVFSDINDLDDLDLPSFEFDLHYLSAFIYWPELQVNHCPLHGVFELLAGQRLQQKSGTNRVSDLWQPCEVVRDDPIESVTAARAALRSITDYCITAWASTHSRILHCLSGGLDSAIVLGCLSNISWRPHVVCVNRYHAAPGEDERLYARRAAELGRFEYIERPWCFTNRVFDTSLLAFPRIPKPYIPLPFGMLDADCWNEVARDYRAQAIWTGEGGDHIFFNVPTALGAADHVKRHRLPFSPGLVSAVIDSARYSREPYLSVWRNAIKLGRSRSPWTSEVHAARTNGASVSFLRHETLPREVDQYIAHPWLSHRDDLPKGKQLQIELLLELVNRGRSVPGLLEAREHHPLISQPLIELSLRIPIYVLTHGGRQRRLAREAFHDLVPDEILAREDKGGTGVLWIKKIRESQPFLRDLLLDGYLAQQGIIDRRSLEPHIAAGQPIRPEQWSPLAACIAAEMWIRSWVGCRTTTTSVHSGAGLPSVTGGLSRI